MKQECLLLLLCAPSFACAIFASPIPSLDELRVGEVREPKLVAHVTRNPHTGVVVREWSEWQVISGIGEKHGAERTWYPNGEREWEREFDHGTPVGHWQGWYEGGARMAESFHGTDLPTLMSFWHANGQLSAQGEALNGVRLGPWKHWYANGQVREEGDYLDGLRTGLWTFWLRAGSLETRGHFEAGTRVGVWE